MLIYTMLYGMASLGPICITTIAKTHSLLIRIATLKFIRLFVTIIIEMRNKFIHAFYLFYLFLGRYSKTRL